MERCLGIGGATHLGSFPTQTTWIPLWRVLGSLVVVELPPRGSGTRVEASGVLESLLLSLSSLLLLRSLLWMMGQGSAPDPGEPVQGVWTSSNEAVLCATQD